MKYKLKTKPIEPVKEYKLCPLCEKELDPSSNDEKVFYCQTSDCEIKRITI